MVNRPAVSLRLSGLPAWVWRTLSTRHGLTFVWLALLSLLSAWGVNQAALHLPDEKIALMALTAAVASSVVFMSRVKGRLAMPALASLAGGYLLIGWAGLGPSVKEIFAAMASAARAALWQTDLVPALTRLQAALLSGNQRALLLEVRLSRWAGGIGGQAAADWLMTQLAWGAALWLAIGFLSWMVWKQHRALLGTLPLGGLLAVALFFGGRGASFMVFFLAGMLLLQAATHSLHHFSGWKARGVDYATDVFVDMQAAAAAASVLIVLAAAAVPNIPLDDLTRAFYRLSHVDAEQVNQVASSFGLHPPPEPASEAGPQGLPRRHLLGDAPELSRQLVMTIRTGELPPMPPEALESVSVPRHYWQSTIYSRYISTGWQMATTRPVKFGPEQPLHNAPALGGRLLQQTVTRGPFATGLLFSDGLPLLIDHPATARQNAQGEATVVSLPAQTYAVTSWQTEAGPSILRAAGTDYPEFIRATYLPLPPDVPQRVRDLAIDLTVGQPTPFDKALAIETYLRRFAYDLDVPQPPLDADVADYFLFDLQKGYCDYYATSMVVLARAAGLPARFVVGYASGSYAPQQAEYRVVEANAHSWPQIYFPGVGWVNFEPTAGQPPLEHAEGGPAAESIDMPPPPAKSGGDWRAALWLGALGAAGLVWGIGWLSDRRLRRTPARQLSAILFGKMWRLAERTGFQTRAGDTPYEFSGRYRRFLQAQALPAAAQSGLSDIHRLAEAFVRRQYAPPGGLSARRDDLWALWRRLRRTLWLAAVWLWLRRWGKKMTRRVYQKAGSQV